MSLITIHVERAADPDLLERIIAMSDATTALASSLDKLATVVSSAVSKLDAATAAGNAPAADPALQDKLTKSQADLDEANTSIAAAQKEIDDLTLQLANSEAPAPGATGTNGSAGSGGTGVAGDGTGGVTQPPASGQ
jgi:seryl-tRNA synthetase